MTLPATTSVLIAGGGPVGLAAAVELGTRGIDCVVLEPRTTVSFLRPRAKTTSVRTMEHFRRWGIVDRVRAAAALPVSWSQRVMATTGLLEAELTRFDDCLGLSATRTDLFAEAGQQIAQPRVEQVLRETVGDLGSATLALGWSLRSLTETDHEVVVEAADADGTVRLVTAQYVLGCDGGRSRTRECLGVPMRGPADARKNTTIVFRAPGLDRLIPHDPAVQYWVFNSRTFGVLGRFDLADHWWAGMMLPSPDSDPAPTLRQLLGPHVPDDLRCDIECVDTWNVRMQLAETFGTGRVFLAGDAAHLNPPAGGHGFNTGIGDAVNIGWKLAATLQGWGGRPLLRSYDAERRQVAADTIAAATASLHAMRDLRIPDDVDSHGPSGDQARRALGETIYRAMYAEFHSLGLVLGYDYAESSVVVDNETPETPAAKDSTVYQPTTRPGARLPHRWLPDGRSLYDSLGAGLTLLSFGHGDAAALTDTAQARGIPLTTVDLTGTDLRLGDHTLLLVRPDHHIAWRGDHMSLPSADLVLDRVLGRENHSETGSLVG